jgi:PAS domain S-box-containing protein
VAALHSEPRTRDELRDFVDTAAVGMHWVAADGTILWANPADYEPLGFAASEYVGHNIAEFHADRDVLADILRRLSRGERITDYPARLRCRDGTLKEVTITSSVLFDEQGRFLHTRCLTRMVPTAGDEHHPLGRQRAADALHLFIDNVQDYAMFLLDAGGHIETWNRGAKRIKGYEAGEIIGQHFSIFYTPEDIKASKPQRLLARAAAEMRVEDEGWRVRKDGSRFWANVVITALRDERGELYGFGKVTRDLTARRAMEDQARRLAEERAARSAAEAAEARVRFLADVGAALSASVDYDATLRKVAELVVPRLADWSTVFALDDEGVFRRRAVIVGDPAKAELAREYEQEFSPARHRAGQHLEVARTGKSVLLPVVERSLLESAAQNEEHLRVLDGLGVRSCMMVPLTSRDGVIGVLNLMRSEVGREYGAGDLVLAEEVASRAALAIENARLFREQRQIASELEAALRIRDEFLAIAGHELRTPLAAMLMQIESLQRAAGRTSEGQRLAERLAKAGAAGARLATLVDQLLDVSRIQAGSFSLDPRPMDLVALVRDVASRQSDQTPTVEIRLDADVGELTGLWDRERLDQVLTNLLSNAVKYGQGSPVEISLRRRGGEAVLEVSDRGIGISPAAQQRIFERFERAAASSDYGGIGLGLWIVRQIVEASGGRIEVRSQPGQGSTFIVSVPIGLEEEPARAAP